MTAPYDRHAVHGSTIMEDVNVLVRFTLVEKKKETKNSLLSENAITTLYWQKRLKS